MSFGSTLWIVFLTGTVATTLGAAPVLALRSLPPRPATHFIALPAGVMLAASVYALLPAALVAAAKQHPGNWATPLTLAALGVGAWCVAWANRNFPHEHQFKGHDGRDSRRSMPFLLVTAIALHNFPEGLSVGVTIDAADPTLMPRIATAIAIQNIPEGLVVAMAMLSSGLGRRRSFALGVLTGLIETGGGLVGAAAVGFAGGLLPWGLAFAAGAMLYVISAEVIPETHRSGMSGGATASLLTGFAAMVWFDALIAG
jgi:ZIP family zinc transporter